MLKTLVAATALSGTLALPAAALELGADATAGISFEDGVQIDAGVSAEADATETDAGPEAVPEGYEVVANSNFVGNSVETSDGVTLGNVTDVYAAAGGEQRVRVEVAEDAGLEKPEAFWLPIAADADADGTLVLPMTKAEFQAEVDEQMKSQG